MKSTWMRSLLFIALSPVLVGLPLLGALPARADLKTDVPKGVTVIDAEQLKRWIDQNKKMHFESYYKLSAPQTPQENCVAHNGSLIPVPGRDIMAQAWYQGGVSVFDFTDSAKPVEIAFFDRGPIDGTQLVTGGYWSAYWYNGQIYGSEIARGLDIFRLKPSEFLSQNELDAAMQFRLQEFNSQNQPKVVWEPTAAVAKAYMDQLSRSKSITAAQMKTVNEALSKADGRSKGAVDQLETLAGQFDADAAKASGIDQKRFKALAETLRGRAARLR